MATIHEQLADDKLAAAARMWERVGHWAWRAEKRSWAQVADSPIGFIDRAGNVMLERGAGYFRARRYDGEERTIWAPVPFI